MSFARRLAVLSLLALWVPALLHCRLEAAGVMFESSGCCDDASSVADAGGCSEDACGVVEGAFVQPGAIDPSWLAPAGHACPPWTGFAAPPPLSPAPARCIAASTAAPPEMARTWIFRARAAPGPRAPAVVS